MIGFLFGLAFMNGPAVYLEKLTQRKNIAASGILVGSFVLSLYFSVIESSYFWSLLFCVVEVIPLLIVYFFVVQRSASLFL